MQPLATPQTSILPLELDYIYSEWENFLLNLPALDDFGTLLTISENFQVVHN